MPSKWNQFCEICGWYLHRLVRVTFLWMDSGFQAFCWQHVCSSVELHRKSRAVGMLLAWTCVYPRECGREVRVVAFFCSEHTRKNELVFDQICHNQIWSARLLRKRRQNKNRTSLVRYVGVRLTTVLFCFVGEWMLRSLTRSTYHWGRSFYNLVSISFHERHQARPVNVVASHHQFVGFRSSRFFSSDQQKMAENRYAADYAKVGTSSCKKCKQKLEKGSFRIAKVSWFGRMRPVVKQHRRERFLSLESDTREAILSDCFFCLDEARLLWNVFFRLHFRWSPIPSQTTGATWSSTSIRPASSKPFFERGRRPKSFSTPTTWKILTRWRMRTGTHSKSWSLVSSQKNLFFGTNCESASGFVLEPLTLKMFLSRLQRTSCDAHWLVWVSSLAVSQIVGIEAKVDRLGVHNLLSDRRTFPDVFPSVMSKTRVLFGSTCCISVFLVTAWFCVLAWLTTLTPTRNPPRTEIFFRAISIRWTAKGMTEKTSS